ncbi:hypothetical protein AAULR_08935 [Lacticaseibacillus rhamnosus MTCC 5462]|nr:hypothetical protein AAULR_08935 [Lacticaseibacillus rhamnosus MTCC 5462]
MSRGLSATLAKRLVIRGFWKAVWLRLMISG